MYGTTTLHTLLALVILATVAVPVLTEAAGRASEVWALPDATSRMAATRHAVLFGLLGMAAALIALVVSQGADAASYKRWIFLQGMATPRRTRTTASVRSRKSTRTTWSPATGSSAAIPTRSFADSFSVNTTAAAT